MSGPQGAPFRAAVLREVGAPLSIERLTLAPLEPTDVLVRMHAAGLCHTDREAMTGAFPVPLPVVLGHEGAGVVEAVGSAVHRVKPGQHVVCTIYAACGQCYYCRRDQPMLCDEVVPNHRSATLSGGRTRLRDGTGEGAGEVGHFLSVSSFAEYAVVPEAAAVPVPAELPFDKACLLGCGVITGVGAVMRVARVGLGDSVVVVGCGPVGLNVVQGARLAGAGAILAIDRRADKLERARAFGATHLIEAGEGVDVAARIRAVTGGRGADHAFEAAGVIGSLQTAIDGTRPGGSVTILGKTDPDRLIELRFGSITGERRILRSSLGGAKAADDFPAYARAYLDGRLQLDELIDRRLPLEAINDAFEAVDRGDIVRAVVVMHE